MKTLDSWQLHKGPFGGRALGFISWPCGVGGDEDALWGRNRQLFVVYNDGRFDALLRISTGDAHVALSGAVFAAPRAAPPITRRAADAASATAGASRRGHTRGTAIRLAGRDGHITVEEMEDLGAAIRGGNANVRNGFADADSAGESHGGRAADADDAVPSCNPLDGIVDDLGPDVDNGRVENVRAEVGDDERLDVARCGHARGADDDERRRQPQTSELGGQTGNSPRTVDDARGRSGGGGRGRLRGGRLVVRPSLGFRAFNRPLAGKGGLSGTTRAGRGGRRDTAGDDRAGGG